MNSHLTYRSAAYRQPPGLAALPTHYLSKSQGLMRITDMHTSHLDAAIANLTGASGVEHTLAALKAERAKRNG